MQRERIQTYINSVLLKALREQAGAEGREESKIIESALLEYLRKSGADYEERSVSTLLAEIQRRIDAEEAPELSDEEAMELANEEVHRYREEHPEIYLSHVKRS